MTKKSTIVILSLLLISFVMTPSFASDTTTTEVGAQVEQVLIVAPPSDADNNLDPTDDGGATVQDDVVSVDNNQGGDSVTVTINPDNSSAQAGSVSVPDYLAVNSNIEFDLEVKAHSDHTDGDGDGTVDLIYSGDQSDPNKPVSDVHINATEIGSTSGTDNTTSISKEVTSLGASNSKATGAIPPDKYFDNNEGLDVEFQFQDTTQSAMPAGFYKLKLIWTIGDANPLV